MNTENLTQGKKVIVGIQFLFVAFGATVLVPLLVGINPATALFTAGLGTFIFHYVTRWKVPIFLGSSFAFIAPINEASKQWGLSGTLSGLTAVSVVYFVMSALVKWQGKRLLNRLFPPVVIGPVIILIGLSLSGTAVDMAKSNWFLAFCSLFTAIMILTFAKGLMKLVPIIAGVVVGYIVALFMHQVDFAGVVAAPWFSFPVKFDTISHFSWEPFLYMLPVAIAPVLEHIGDVYVVSAVAKKDFVAQPGLHRTMFGDGFSLPCLCLSWRSTRNNLFRSDGSHVDYKGNEPCCDSHFSCNCFIVFGHRQAQCTASECSKGCSWRNNAIAFRNDSKRRSAESHAT